ncbi:molybdopterin molybdotransferase [Luteibacter sp. Sphag1AF]|uniref:molybdopterin molybdotransferase MoeA n=1 Tax=Luteibacter sp. Sphag1AF TaxID=2587031 RepID=UPI00160B3946|nr:molybdopterin molybdotransferase MoeA [Luteibacter sp. Sphag1AF]MBB3225763.1 molybdopterin molybdotransferase [Luteibacter sp. Sphag1AF]
MLLAIEAALGEYRRHVMRRDSERVPVTAALGAVLAEAPGARIALPRFTQSALDGYALCSADGLAPRELIGTSAAGDPSPARVGPGLAVRIYTGGMLPEGADAIARQEIVDRDGGRIHLREAVAEGTGVRYAGEELAAGTTLALTGQRVTSGLVAALCMAGVDEVLVRQRPRIAVLVTGDEIRRAGEPLGPGQVYDANGPLLRSWFVEQGYGEPSVVYVPDDEEALARAMQQALDSADLVVTSGGVSVGDRDFVPVVAERLGVSRVFWKVAQKPGKPLWFGMRGNTALLGMPGNPAAVLVCLAVHARAVLGHMEGLTEPMPQWRSGVLSSEVEADAERDRLVRMRMMDHAGTVELEVLPKQDSHMLSNLASAHALVWLPSRELPFAAGERVRWLAL